MPGSTPSDPPLLVGPIGNVNQALSIKKTPTRRHRMGLLAHGISALMQETAWGTLSLPEFSARY